MKAHGTVPEDDMRVAFLIFLSSFVAVPFGPPDEQTVEVAARHWEEYIKACGRLSGVIRERAVIEDGTLAVTAESEWREVEGCWLARRNREVHFTMPGQPAGFTEDVCCFNSMYAFIVERKEREGAFRVTEVGLRGQLSGTLKTLEEEMRTPPRRVPKVLRMVDNPYHTLPSIVASESFRVISAGKVPDAPGMIFLSCEYHDRAYGHTRFTVHLATERYWLPVYYTVSTSESNIEGHNTIAEGEGGFPLCTMMTWTGEHRARNFVERGTRTILLEESFSPPPQPESAFTLTAFGLPEPFGVTWERPTPWWLYALISAGVLFVVAVIVSFWKRRLAARSAG